MIIILMLILIPILLLILMLGIVALQAAAHVQGEPEASSSHTCLYTII